MSKNLSVSHNDVGFIVQGHQLSGVTSVDGSYSITQNPINVLGFGYTTPTVAGPSVGNFSINRNMVSADPLMAYTGEGYFNGSISYGGKSFGFTSGYLSDYSISCSIAEVPSISNTIEVFGDIGGGVQAWDSEAEPTFQHSQPGPYVQIPKHGSIQVTCDGSSSNRVQAFSYSIKSARRPTYQVNSSVPVQVDLDYPLEINCIIVLEIDDYESKKAVDFLSTHSTSDITIEIKGLDRNSVMQATQTLSIINPELINESINTSFGQNSTIELTYKGYVNKRNI